MWTPTLGRLFHSPAKRVCRMPRSRRSLGSKTKNGLMPVTGRRSRELQQRAFSFYGNPGLAVNHLFALSIHALMSAFLKIIFATKLPNLGLHAPDIRLLFPSGFSPNAMAAFFRGCRFQSVIRLGCTSNCSASSATVLSPFRAARAT
jgi:hypothetical protein